MTEPSPLATPFAWNLVAADYALDIVPIFSVFAQKAIALAGVGPGSRVLDVAAGPGTLAFVAEAVGAHVTAIDFSPEMIEKLRIRAERKHAAIEAHLGDGQALPFSDECFEHAFSMFGLMFFPDRAQGFRELHRVLVPGGRAVVSSWLPSDRVPLFGRVWGTLREFLPSLPLGGSAPPLARREDCLSEMRDGGFEDVEVIEVTHKQRYSSMHELWAGMVRTTAPIALLREKMPNEWPRVQDGVLERLLEEFGEGPQELPMPANLIVGRRAE